METVAFAVVNQHSNSQENAQYPFINKCVILKYAIMFDETKNHITTKGYRCQKCD